MDLPPPNLEHMLNVPAIEYHMSEEELGQYVSPSLDHIFSIENLENAKPDFPTDFVNSHFPFIVPQFSKRVDSDKIPNYAGFYPGRYLGRPENKFGFGVRLINDNRILTNDAFFKFLPDDASDDFGLTHGSELFFNYGFDNGLFLNLVSGTKLYSFPVEKIPNGDKINSRQYFLNENYIVLTLDDLNLNRDINHIVDVGMHRFQDIDDGGFHNASRQQDIWHNFMSDFHEISIPVNILGNYDDAGFFIGYHADFEYPFAFISDYVALDVGLNAGGFLSTIPEASSLDASARLGIAYQKNFESVGIRAGLEGKVQYHIDGVRPSLNATLEIGNDWFNINMGLEQYFGDSMQTVKYDIRNGDRYDVIHSLSIEFFL